MRYQLGVVRMHCNGVTLDAAFYEGRRRRRRNRPRGVGPLVNGASRARAAHCRRRRRRAVHLQTRCIKVAMRPASRAGGLGVAAGIAGRTSCSARRHTDCREFIEPGAAVARQARASGSLSAQPLEAAAPTDPPPPFPRCADRTSRRRLLRRRRALLRAKRRGRPPRRTPRASLRRGGRARGATPRALGARVAVVAAASAIAATRFRGAALPGDSRAHPARGRLASSTL